MTTVQETSNGHRVSPPPCHDPTGTVSSDLSAGAPVSKIHRERGISSEPLSPRCQFTFSDSRQCTMARSDIHPSLCPFHAEREEQLFGSPSPGGTVVGAAFDLAELYSACRDLTTAAGVNRALAQVFRLLAQRRISRQEAATFGHLARLLLRTITLAHAESASAPADGARADATSPVIRSEQWERKISPEPAPERDTSPPPSPVCEQVPSPPHRNGASAPPDFVCNSTEINTYENVELKPLQNEHLREIPGGGTPRDKKTEILPAQPLSLLHQEPRGPQSEQHCGRLENTKGAGVRLGIGHGAARRR